MTEFGDFKLWRRLRVLKSSPQEIEQSPEVDNKMLISFRKVNKFELKI